jgi:hypothetical protein
MILMSDMYDPSLVFSVAYSTHAHTNRNAVLIRAQLDHLIPWIHGSKSMPRSPPDISPAGHSTGSIQDRWEGLGRGRSLTWYAHAFAHRNLKWCFVGYETTRQFVSAFSCLFVNHRDSFLTLAFLIVMGNFPLTACLSGDKLWDTPIKKRTKNSNHRSSLDSCTWRVRYSLLVQGQNDEHSQARDRW